jgi:hypothetical protein
MTRRVSLLALLGGAAIAQKRPDSVEAELQWNDFATEWNKMAELLRGGVFNERQWKRVQKAFRRLEERCESHER